MIAFLSSHFLIDEYAFAAKILYLQTTYTPNTYIHTLGIWGFHQTRV